MNKGEVNYMGSNSIYETKKTLKKDRNLTFKFIWIFSQGTIDNLASVYDT